MKKFLTTLIALFLGVSLAACSSTNADSSSEKTTVLLKNEDAVKNKVIIKYVDNKILNIEETGEIDYSTVQGGRKAVEQIENSVKNVLPEDFKKVFTYSIEYGENSYKSYMKNDFAKADFTKQSELFEYLGFALSDDGTFIDYEQTVKQYENKGYVKE